jgi:hypothetical protein
MYDPDHPEISGSITPASDDPSTTEGETLIDFLRRLNDRLRAQFIADAEAVVPLDGSTDHARGARPGPDAIPGQGFMRDEPLAAESIADEARRLHSGWRQPKRADRKPGVSGSWLIRLITGFVLGLVVGTLGTILMSALSDRLDADLLLFASWMLINGAALVVSIMAVVLRWPRLAGFGLGFVGGLLVFSWIGSDCLQCRIVLSRLGLY